MQETKLRSKNGSLHEGERKFVMSEIRNLEQVQGAYKKEVHLNRNMSSDKQCQFTLLSAGRQLHQYTSVEKVENTDLRRIWCLPCSYHVMPFFPSGVVFLFNVHKFSIYKISLENVNSLMPIHVGENTSVATNTGFLFRKTILRISEQPRGTVTRASSWRQETRVQALLPWS